MYPWVIRYISFILHRYYVVIDSTMDLLIFRVQFFILPSFVEYFSKFKSCSFLYYYYFHNYRPSNWINSVIFLLKKVLFTLFLSLLYTRVGSNFSNVTKRNIFFEIFHNVATMQFSLPASMSYSFLTISTDWEYCLQFQQ